MSVLNLSNIKALALDVIDAEKIGIGQEDYLEGIDKNDFTNLVIKIGKQIMNDSTFTDRLPELDFEELTYGTTIEEYFMDLVLPDPHDPSGATTLAPRDVNFKDPYYSKELERKTTSVTIRDNAWNNGMLGREELAGLAARVLKRLYDSQEVYKYSLKKQMLGEFASRATKPALYTELAVPNDAASGENWIKQVKEKVLELGTFITEDNNLAEVLATSPSLTMYVKGSKLTPSIDVDTLAGAFNEGRVQIPVDIKVVEDFGTITGANADAWAILIDPRGVGVHHHSTTATHQYNGEGEFTNYFLHYTPIGYLSHYTNIHVWRLPAE